MKHNQIFSIGAITWGIIIFILCAMPSQDIPNPGLNIPNMDKIVHFGMHFIMALLIITLLRGNTRMKRSQIMGVAIGFTFIYGGIIEILQAKYFNRGGDWLDELANLLGAITACFLYKYLRKEKDKWINRFKNGK